MRRNGLINIYTSIAWNVNLIKYVLEQMVVVYVDHYILLKNNNLLINDKVVR